MFDLSKTHFRCSHFTVCKTWIPFGSRRFCYTCQDLFDIASKSFEQTHVTLAGVVRRDDSHEPHGKVWPNHSLHPVLTRWRHARLYDAKVKLNLLYGKFVRRERTMFFPEVSNRRC